MKPAPKDSPVRVAVEGVITRWKVTEDMSCQTIDRSEETLRRFAARLGRSGFDSVGAITPAMCRGFIDAHTRDAVAPELATRHARRVTLRMFFRALRDLGYPVGDPTLDIPLPPRSARPARPLIEDEVGLGRVSARLGNAGSASLLRAAAWALAEATAVTSEITTVRIQDLDNPRTPGWVHLAGTTRHDPREGELSQWGSTILGRHIGMMLERGCTPDALVTYRGGATPGQAAAQATACNAIAAILDAAGLSDEPDVRPGSVRNWAGRTLYDSGMPLEKVARRMGARKIDTCAQDIALEWR